MLGVDGLFLIFLRAFFHYRVAGELELTNGQQLYAMICELFPWVGSCNQDSRFGKTLARYSQWHVDSI